MLCKLAAKMLLIQQLNVQCLHAAIFVVLHLSIGTAFMLASELSQLAENDHISAFPLDD